MRGKSGILYKNGKEDPPTRSTIPSATPSAHAASTLPPTYLIFVASLPIVLPLRVPPLTSTSSKSDFSLPESLSSFSKYSPASPMNEVQMLFPINSFGSRYSPFTGTWICSLQRPNWRSRSSSTSLCASATWSRPVIPKSTRPSPTNVGMSAAGRKTSAIGRLRHSAMSRRE